MAYSFPNSPRPLGGYHGNQLESLMFVTVRDEIGRGELVFKKAFKEAGLSPLVGGNIEYVQIRLTPKLYDEILGE